MRLLTCLLLCSMRGYPAVVDSVVALHALLDSRVHGPSDPILSCRRCSAQHVGMVGVLTKEQGDDDSQKDFCDAEFEKSAAEKKDTEEALASLAASIEEMTATVSTLASEIETLQVLGLPFGCGNHAIIVTM